MSGDIKKHADHDPLTSTAGYDVDSFAQRHGISPAKARELIQRFGHDRARLDAEAAKFKQS